MKIQRGDTVKVISGEDRSDQPRRVLQVLDGGKKLLIEGVNRVYKHVRRGHPKSPQGGRLHLEMPINSSKVVLVCSSCNRGVRVGYRYSDDGSKERFCKACGTTISKISPPRKQYAK